MIDYYQIFYWTVTIAAITGVILNIKKDKRCFYIWTGTNGAFALETFLFGAYNMTFLFSIYFILAVWGIYSWHDDFKEGKSSDRTI